MNENADQRCDNLALAYVVSLQLASFLRESADGIWVRFAGIVAWLALVSVLSAATLSNPRRVGTGFEFSVTGEANAIYAIEASSDLQNWTLLATNRQFGEVRTISMPASAPEEFYRVRPLQPLFTAALAVRESIDFAGAGVTVVSFDSRDPRYFDPDGRLDPTRFGDRADITTSSALTNSLNLGNAKVYGHVRAPQDGVLVLGPGGAVGSILWHLNGGRGIQEGWYVEVTPRVFVDAEVPTGQLYVTLGRGLSTARIIRTCYQTGITRFQSWGRPLCLLPDARPFTLRDRPRWAEES